MEVYFLNPFNLLMVLQILEDFLEGYFLQQLYSEFFDSKFRNKWENGLGIVVLYVAFQYIKKFILPADYRIFHITENLMGQKQLFLEWKEELINSTLEKGYDVTSIQDILDSYEKQLKELDQQFSQEIAKQNEKQLEAMQSSKKNYKQKTKQEMEQEKISNLIELSSGISQTKVLQSSQTQVEGEARVLENGIKMDKGKSTDTEMLDKIDEHNKNTAQELLKEETIKDSNSIDENIEYKESNKRDFDENTIEVEKWLTNLLKLSIVHTRKLAKLR